MSRPAVVGALATPHALATESGVRVLRDGGTAVDAAIAAAAVLTVVYPHNVALGGDLFALIRTPDGSVNCVNASGWSGAAVDAAGLRAVHGDAMPVRGAAAVTVPGGVRGWEALRRFGSRISWSATLRDAEVLARDGVPVPRSLAHHLDDAENDDLIGTADFDRVFRPESGPLSFGETFRQPALADTFAALRAAGPDAFYTGELAVRTVDYLRSHGSSLAAGDFADFQPEVRTPLRVEFGGLTVLTSPPNSQGFALLDALAAVRDNPIGDPTGVGLGQLLQAFQRGNEIRDTILADPRFGTDEASAPPATPPGRTTGDTVGIAAADGDGYAVSLIQSVYYAFGSGLIDPATGVLFHNRGCGFSLDVTSPNVIAPRKRPAHTLMPVLTVRDGHVAHVLSTMGGQGQPQILGQILLHALSGASAIDAVAAPRAIIGNQIGGGADSVTVEADVSAAALDSIRRAGYTPTVVPAHSESMGQSNVVFIDDRGGMTAAADPRADGAAVVAHYPRPA
ncbi:gamma-glutamyltransferase [Mycobacterium crocinum]|uniref:Gamma-glutamyltransferase n=1 Tax=Mycolicibacterium crocinum TaxID=388459 RepID=A0ABY3TVI6_9MYCO|nr:gamma-glutamyltransferase [Mycolicibacterium crocinum]MCV7217246.1 gamma-glutamyltransferase [Mycolicibacterium crocinum]ULN42977.1 gamma-glutamyltransferase [Mycolicibacterium crocinum]